MCFMPFCVFFFMQFSSTGLCFMSFCVFLPFFSSSNVSFFWHLFYVLLSFFVFSMFILLVFLVFFVDNLVVLNSVEEVCPPMS